MRSGLDRHRFIPACAGNAMTWTLDSMIETVHPRVCRERYSVIVSALIEVGSSPRVQGTRRQPG